eukprot:CFRG0642T1
MSTVEEHKARGNECYSACDFKTAAKFYTKALGLATEPEIRGTLFSNRSAAYLNNLQYDEAMSDACDSVRYRPTWPKSHFRLGEINLRLRKFPAAKKAFKESLSLDPENSRTKSKLFEAEKYVENEDQGLIIVQLLPGQDICLSTYNPIQLLVNKFAKMMKNFIYIIADAKTREAVVVDICWDMAGVLKRVQQLDLKLVGAIVTHYHFDHTGGKPPPPYDKYPVTVDGIATLTRKFKKLKVYAGPIDAATLRDVNGVAEDQIVTTTDSQEIVLGEHTKLKFIHTPGHTPGSQSILVNDCRLFTGDTVFIGGCGRLDFPDCDGEAMYDTMRKLKELSNDIVIYPGHKYGGTFTTMSHEKQFGALQPMGKDMWRRTFNPAPSPSAE